MAKIPDDIPDPDVESGPRLTVPRDSWPKGCTPSGSAPYWVGCALWYTTQKEGMYPGASVYHKAPGQELQKFSIAQQDLEDMKRDIWGEIRKLIEETHTRDRGEVSA